MERKAYQIASPVALVVVMMAFLSAIFMANATPSQAASAKKSSAVASKTAVELAESRITQLKDALKITDEQEVLWGNVTQAMRENAKDMDALSKAKAENAPTMNAVERMKLHSEMTQAQLDQQKKFIPAFEALYVSMTDAQKATTDSIFRTGKHGKHKIK